MAESKGESIELLSIEEAVKLLGISRATFNNIRRELDISEVMVGKRPRFVKSELISTFTRRLSTKAPRRKSKAAPLHVPLNIFSTHKIDELEVSKNVFDLRLLNQPDPYGVLSLLCTLVARSQSGKKIKLLINDGHTCQYLKTIQFFYQIEREAGDRISWDREILRGASIQDTSILMPINAIRTKGGERIIAENLLKLLRQQGFKDSVGRGITQILGELADNAMTHSKESLSERVCYISAKRFIIGESNCIIVGVADTGLGIPASLKSNPKYAELDDPKALLESFRPFVTSYVDTPRGKGLTDVLSIAMGNHSILRVDSGDIGLQMDFREEAPRVEFKSPMTDVTGTRFGLILIDTNFEKKTRSDVDLLITEKAKDL